MGSMPFRKRSLIGAAFSCERGGKPGRILVVDDDLAARRMVTCYFEEHDIPASSAAGRHELSHYLLTCEPCLIILDRRPE